MNTEKFKGVFPAFYACYDDNGEISAERTQLLAKHLMEKGVKGLYVGGSSGECIYQSVEDRKKILENVMKAVKGKLTIIAHVACNNTKDSCELAAHAESQGVDAIAAIPPIYFHLPEYAIAEYWNDISAAAPNTPFIIYNIPQLSGTTLTMSLYKNMLKNPNVLGVKNSSMATQDIQMFKTEAEDYSWFIYVREQMVERYGTAEQMEEYRRQAELRGTPGHKAKNWMGSMLFHLSHANDVDQAWASSRTREELDQVVEPFVQAKRQTGQWMQEDEAGYQLYRQETDPKKRTFRVWYLIANPRGLPKEFVQKELEFRWKLFPEKKEETK